MIERAIQHAQPDAPANAPANGPFDHESGNGIAGIPRLRGRKLALPFDAVVHRGALDALGLSVLTLTRAVRFCLLERAGFPRLVHGGLTRTRSRSIVPRRRVRASGHESRAPQDYPFHVEPPNAAQCSPASGAEP